MWSDKIDIEPIYEELLHTFLYNDDNTIQLDDNFETDSIFDYAQNAFRVDYNFHSKMIKLAQSRTPTILRVEVKCLEGKYLRARSVSATGNYMVNIFKGSSSDHVNSTKIQIDTNNPKWTDIFSIPINRNIDNDTIEFEVFDCSADVDSKKNENFSKPGSSRGIKSLIKELTPGGNKSKRMIGRTAVSLASIKHNGLDVWLNLEKDGQYNNRGAIHVQINYCVDKPRDVFLEEYQCLVEHLLQYELEVSRVADYWWDGKLSESGDIILRAYRSRVHMSELEVALSKWSAFTNVHIGHPLSFILFDSMLSKFLKLLNDSETDTDMKYILEGAARLLPSCFTQIHNQVATKIHDGTLKVVLNILAKLQQLIDTKSERNDVFNFSIVEALKNAILDGANDWFEQQIEQQNISYHTIDSENITKIDGFIRMLKLDLSQALKLDEFFRATNNVRFVEILFLVYDEKLSKILETVLKMTDSDWQILYCTVDQPDIIQQGQENNITVALFQLYLTLKEFMALGPKIADTTDSLKLNEYENWFSGALTHWLELGMEKATNRIEIAVKQDKFEPENEDVKYSSSAIDTLGIICQVKYIWEQLEWSDDLGSFMIIVKIIYDICRLCAFYANKIQSSLEDLHLNHNHDKTNFQITQQWCLAINNIEFIRDKIETIINESSIKDMVSRISNRHSSVEAERAAETFENVIEYMNDKKNYTIQQSIIQVIQHLSSNIKKNLETAVKSKNFKTTAFSDLLEYIDSSMFTLRTDLNAVNFQRFLELLWGDLINVFDQTIGLAVKNQNSPEFYKNLKSFYYNLVYIVTTVNPTDENFMNGCPSLLYMDRVLNLHTLETSHLVHEYHSVRAQSQKHTFDPKQATLTVKYHFSENDLVVEIINARNLEKNLPFNTPKCNPIVKVHLVSVDQSRIEYSTKLQKSTTVPLIDEKCQIKLGDRKNDRTLILFSVWTCNGAFKTEKLLGECYVALKDVPENYDKRQKHLNLTRSCDATKPVLKIIESRRWYDKEAEAFLNSIPRLNMIHPNCCNFYINVFRIHH